MKTFYRALTITIGWITGAAISFLFVPFTPAAVTWSAIGLCIFCPIYLYFTRDKEDV